MKNYTNKFYNEYREDIYSQNGEDGILEELLKRLEISKGWVCEFGAWDGKHLSNTFNLITKGFNGVFIEGDENKYEDLLKTVAEYPNIIPINTFVSHNTKEQNLDSILSKTEIPKNFDVLSIDIDSYDYQVWKSVELYKPKIVVIEINSGVKVNNINHIHGVNGSQGTGFRPILNLGMEKDYKFVLHTGNMIFVDNQYFNKLNVNYENVLENFRNTWNGGD